MRTILDVENLSKSFDNIQILNKISFKVEEGAFIAIMGQSGSGKSTLLYNISGMDRPTSGKVLLNDRDISELPEEKISEVRLKEMGFIFQHSHLLKNLSIRDNIILPGFKSGLLSRDEINSRGELLMKKTGILNIAAHDIKKVSGGQLQRAAICRALVLFGDEPTGALNSSTSKEVMNIINSVNEEGTTVILVTHDAKVASRASRVIYLLDGNIHDELMLTKYKDSEESAREKKLSAWLEKHGF